MIGRIAIGAALLVALSACGEGSPLEKEPTEFNVTGSLTLSDTMSVVTTTKDDCWGTGGYDDIQAGAQVVVYDNKGAMLASSELDPGVAEGDELGVCTFKFKVPNVPIADTDLYSVEVTSRGKITFTQAEAGSVGLTLG
jgi:hypothetical protein